MSCDRHLCPWCLALSSLQLLSLCAFLTIHVRFHVAGFEHMWGPATVPGLGHHSSVGLGQQQAAAPAAARLPDDFPVLDFPDWDGPGDSLHPFPCTNI